MFDFEDIGRPKDFPSHWNKFVELFSLRMLPRTIAALNHSVDFKMLVPDASLRLLNLNDELEGLLSEPVLNSFVFTARYAWTVKIPIKVTRDRGRILAFTTHPKMSIRPTVPGLNLPSLQDLQDLVNKKPFNLYKTTFCSHLCSWHKNKADEKVLCTINIVGYDETKATTVDKKNRLVNIGIYYSVTSRSYAISWYKVEGGLKLTSEFVRSLFKSIISITIAVILKLGGAGILMRQTITRKIPTIIANFLKSGDVILNEDMLFATENSATISCRKPNIKPNWYLYFITSSSFGVSPELNWFVHVTFYEFFKRAVQKVLVSITQDSFSTTRFRDRCVNRYIILRTTLAVEFKDTVDKKNRPVSSGIYYSITIRSYAISWYKVKDQKCRILSLIIAVFRVIVAQIAVLSLASIGRDVLAQKSDAISATGKSGDESIAGIWYKKIRCLGLILFTTKSGEFRQNNGGTLRSTINNEVLIICQFSLFIRKWEN